MTGDLITGAAIVLVAAVLGAIGYATGRFKVAVLLALALAAAALVSDLLYFSFGINLGDYCGEPKCDPGPIPLAWTVPFIPLLLAPVGFGVAVRTRRRRAS